MASFTRFCLRRVSANFSILINVDLRSSPYVDREYSRTFRKKSLRFILAETLDCSIATGKGNASFVLGIFYDIPIHSFCRDESFVKSHRSVKLSQFLERMCQIVQAPHRSAI